MIRSLACLRKSSEWYVRRDAVGVSVLHVVGADKTMISSNSAQVHHSSVVGHLHGLPDTGLLALHHTQFISRVVNAKRDHFISWQPLPAETDVRTENSLTGPSESLKASRYLPWTFENAKSGE